MSLKCIFLSLLALTRLKYHIFSKIQKYLVYFKVLCKNPNFQVILPLSFREKLQFVKSTTRLKYNIFQKSKNILCILELLIKIQNFKSFCLLVSKKYAEVRYFHIKYIHIWRDTRIRYRLGLAIVFLSSGACKLELT